MPEYLVELYVSRVDREAVVRSVEQARVAAEALAREGVGVRHLRSIFVPEDETCFLLYEAPSAEVVREAVRRASLQVERVSEAFTEPAGR